jgi:hypothetical protein
MILKITFSEWHRYMVRGHLMTHHEAWNCDHEKAQQARTLTWGSPWPVCWHTQVGHRPHRHEESLPGPRWHSVMALPIFYKWGNNSSERLSYWTGFVQLEASSPLSRRPSSPALPPHMCTPHTLTYHCEHLFLLYLGPSNNQDSLNIYHIMA